MTLNDFISQSYVDASWGWQSNWDGEQEAVLTSEQELILDWCSRVLKAV